MAHNFQVLYSLHSQVFNNIGISRTTQAGVVRTEVEEPSIGEKLLLAGLETCDKVGEERITLACRFVCCVMLFSVPC